MVVSVPILAGSGRTPNAVVASVRGARRGADAGDPGAVATTREDPLQKLLLLLVLVAIPFSFLGVYFK